MRNRDQSELVSLLNSFESCTITREDWGHPEHLIVAYFYSKDAPLKTAYVRMKDGIFRLLEAFSIDLESEMPYHETLTVLWITAVHSFASANSNLTDEEACRTLVESYDKHFPARFYSHERLFSEEARKRFVPPDRAPELKEDSELLGVLRPLE